MVKHQSYADNPQAWLAQISANRGADEAKFLQQFLALYEKPDLKPELAKGIDIANILFLLDLDTETLAASLLYPAIQLHAIHFDTITEMLGESGNKLLHDVLQMQSLGALQQLNSPRDVAHQVEKLRKMLLAMVTDVRAVLIILAERLWKLRQAKQLPVDEQRALAQETHDVYAPLANRLGIWQLKWELEDLCLRYLQPTVYMKIAKWLATKREEREKYIQTMLTIVSDLLTQASIKDFKVTGRVKHIDSIHKKMLRKNVTIEEIYDISAIRLLVPTIEDCYQVLSILQNHWQQVPKEFDDYISQPKANGYRSIHTVILGPENRYIEVQIRTHQMHHESELGVAAHWRYKEKISHTSDYENKIALLRQIMAWQREVTGALVNEDRNKLNQPYENVHAAEETAHAQKDEMKKNISTTDLFADRVYVFTPTGEIIDLPKGSTPLDFAYHIHSEVGHRCRGAKVDGKMVTLKYPLQTGERVEILTAKHANPSRDWLNPHLGYMKSPRARARAQHWFRMQDNAQNLSYGRDLLEKELKRLGNVEKFDLLSIAQKLHFKSTDDMLVSLGSGDVKITQITQFIRSATHAASPSVVTAATTLGATAAQHGHTAATASRSSQHASEEKSQGIKISGISNLVTQLAQCCKPLPGEAVVGYVTRNRAVTIHRRSCGNILNQNKVDKLRLIEVNWSEKETGHYPVHLIVRTNDRSGLLRDLTAVLANEKINLLGLTTSRIPQAESQANIFITIEVNNVAQLKRAIDLMRQIQSVIEVRRQ